MSRDLIFCGTQFRGFHLNHMCGWSDRLFHVDLSLLRQKNISLKVPFLTIILFKRGEKLYCLSWPSNADGIM